MTRYLARFALCLTAALAPLPLPAQLPEPAFGADTYLELRPSLPTSDPSRIVVTEFFSYQCPHCFAFFPALASWAQSLADDVLFERVPVSIGHEPWVPIARAYYALEAIGALEALDAPLFRAIHTQGRRLTDAASIASWVSAQGVDAAAFASAYESFSVGSFAARAEDSARAHRIPSVPTIVVNGRYVVPIYDSGRAGDFEAQLARVSALVARERARAHGSAKN